MGRNACCGTVMNSTATGNVVINSSGGVFYVGGFVGDWGCCGVDRQNTSSGNVTVTVTDPTSIEVDGIGGYAGYMEGDGSLNNITSTGNVTVTGGHEVGGFAGMAAEASNFRDIVVTGNVVDSYNGLDSNNWRTNSDASVGGFIGFLQGGTDINRVAVHNNVTVTAIGSAVPSGVGGLVGSLKIDYKQPLTIENSYYRGTVSGVTNVAGFIGNEGRDFTLSLANNYLAATVVASGTDAVVDPVANGYYQDARGTNSSIQPSQLQR